MPTADLDTPAVTVRLDVMESNTRRVQAHPDRYGIANRPHIKTHKIPAIGAMQMRGGAMGITCMVDEIYGIRADAVEVVWAGGGAWAACAEHRSEKAGSASRRALSPWIRLLWASLMTGGAHDRCEPGI